MGRKRGRDDKRDKRGKREKREGGPDRKQRKKYCAFCRDKTPIDYKDTGTLRRFTSDRGKIKARRTTGNCAQHQRDVAIAVKTARELALMPYSAR